MPIAKGRVHVAVQKMARFCWKGPEQRQGLLKKINDFKQRDGRSVAHHGLYS